MLSQPDFCCSISLPCTPFLTRFRLMMAGGSVLSRRRAACACRTMTAGRERVASGLRLLPTRQMAPLMLRLHAQLLPDGSCAAVPADAGTSQSSVFVCHLCQSAFAQRKLLCAHLAKTHGCLSPARHFAPTEWCLACMGYFHCPLRVQQHLKQSARCMSRMPLLVAPLTVPEIHAVEAASKMHARKLKQGRWNEFRAVLPALRACGPAQPTLDERGLGEDVSVSELSRLFRPTPDVVTWIRSYVQGRTTEGKRTGTADFWGQRVVSPRA